MRGVTSSVMFAAVGAVAGAFLTQFLMDERPASAKHAEARETLPLQPAADEETASPQLTAATVDAPSAGIVDQGMTRTEVAAMLASFGMNVQDSTTREADPWLTATAPKGTVFYVNMYDCIGTGATNRRCNNLQFLAQWELDKAGLDSANVYNQKFVFGRAYLSPDGKMFMFDYAINIKGGVTRTNLQRHIDNWLRVLDDIRSHLKV